MKQTQVLIIGAGPSGLVSALCLAKLGVASIIIERNEGVNIHPKAHELNARSIEILTALGISSEELEEEASPASDGSRVLFCKTVNEEFGRIDMADFKQKYEQHLQAKRPYLNISQTAFEKILLGHVHVNPLIQLLYHHQWESLTETETGVTSEVLDRNTNERLTIQSQFVLAADGAGSRCRKFLNIEMEGPERMEDFASAYFESNLREHIQIPAKLYFFINPMASGSLIAHHIEKRWVYMIPIYPQYQKKEDFTKDFFEKQIKIALGKPSLTIDVKSISFWQMSAQIATSYRKGRVLLVGDAAHRFPPTGGLGMNTGIADAHNIGWKVKAVLSEIADISLLDTYEVERKPIAIHNCTESAYNYDKVLDIPDAFGFPRDGLLKVAKWRNTAPIKWLPKSWKDKLMGFAAVLASKKLARFHKDAVFKEKILATIAKQAAHFDRIGLDIGYSYEAGAVIPDGTKLAIPSDEVRDYLPAARPGARFPYIDFQSHLRLNSHDLLAYGLFTLLIREEGSEWEKAYQQLPKVLRECQQLVKINELAISETVYSSFIDLCQIEGTGALLIRPDGHVAWRMKALEGDASAILKAVFEQIYRKSFNSRT